MPRPAPSPSWLAGGTRPRTASCHLSLVSPTTSPPAWVGRCCLAARGPFRGPQPPVAFSHGWVEALGSLPWSAPSLGHREVVVPLPWPQCALLGIGDPGHRLISHSSSGESPRRADKEGFEEYKEPFSRRCHYYCYLDAEIREGGGAVTVAKTPGSCEQRLPAWPLPPHPASPVPRVKAGCSSGRGAGPGWPVARQLQGSR